MNIKKTLQAAQYAAKNRKPLPGLRPFNTEPANFIAKRKSFEMAKTLEKYPTLDKLCDAMDFQCLARNYCQLTPEKLIMSSGAKLVEIDKIYNIPGAAQLVAATLIASLNDYQSKKEEYRFDSYQIEKISRDLLRRCKQLTLPEFVVMIDKMASGVYGKFYGSMDIQEVYSWADLYMKERGTLIDNPTIREYLLIREQNVTSDFKRIE